MAARPIDRRRTIGTVDGFTRFYRTNLPTLYGYLLRLCAATERSPRT